MRIYRPKVKSNKRCHFIRIAQIFTLVDLHGNFLSHHVLRAYDPDEELRSPFERWII